MYTGAASVDLSLQFTYTIFLFILTRSKYIQFVLCHILPTIIYLGILLFKIVLIDPYNFKLAISLVRQVSTINMSQLCIRYLIVSYLKYFVKLSKAILRTYFIDCERKFEETFVK